VKDALIKPTTQFNARLNEYVEGKVAVRYGESYIENTCKLVVITPSEKVQRIFNKVLDLDPTVFEEMSPENFSNWILGSRYSSNPFN
jgi:hypothetical protein